MKYSLRCVTSCVRSNKGLSALLANPNTTVSLLDTIVCIGDIEMIANSAKILRIMLTESKVKDQLTRKHPNLGNILVERLDLFKVSEVVIIEILMAVKNFTKTPESAKLINSNLLTHVVGMCLHPPNNKIQNLAIELIQNLMVIESYHKKCL